jgi:hypothetical protein
MNQGQSQDPIGGANDEDTVFNLLQANTQRWMGEGAAARPPSHPERPPSDPGTAYNRLPPLKPPRDSKPPTAFVLSKLRRPAFVVNRGSVPTYLQTDVSLAVKLTCGESIVPTHEDPERDRLWLTAHHAQFNPQPQTRSTSGPTEKSVIDAVLIERGLRIMYHRTDTAVPASTASEPGALEQPAKSIRLVHESYQQLSTDHDYQLADYRRRHPEHELRQTTSGSRDGKAPNRKDSGTSGRTMRTAEESPQGSRRGSIHSDVTEGGGIRGDRSQLIEQTIAYDAADVPHRTWIETDKGRAYGFAGGPRFWTERIEGGSMNEEINL